MRIEQRCQELKRIREELETELKDLSFDGIKRLVLRLKQDTMFQRIKSYDNQLTMLEVFCDIWIEEKKQLESIGIHEDIFWGIQSLSDIERRFLLIKYCALRIENNVPLEFCEQSVDKLIEYQVSGIAMATIFLSESIKRVENVLKLAQLLKEKKETIRAIHLLQQTDKVYPANKDVLLELADCWLVGGLWKQAYECLCKIEEPDDNIRELMRELEKVI